MSRWDRHGVPNRHAPAPHPTESIRAPYPIRASTLALDELVSQLDAADVHPDQTFTVWYSHNDGCWKWATDNDAPDTSLREWADKHGLPPIGDTTL